MDSQNILSDSTLRALYEAPWTIRGNRENVEQGLQEKYQVPASELFLMYYEIKTGRRGEQLNREADDRAVHIKAAIPALSVSFPDFVCLTDEVPEAHHARSSRSFELPPVNVYSFDNVAIGLNHGIPLVARQTKEETHVFEQVSSGHYEVLNIQGGGVTLRDNKISLARVFYINDHFGANNYAHWLLDWLPRLKFLVEDKALRYHHLIFGMPTSRAQRQVLSALKIDSSRVLSVNKATLTSTISFAAENAVGLSIAGPGLRRPAQACSPWALDFVRSVLLKPQEGAIPRQRRVLISRKSTRKLLLSPETRGALEQTGFEEVFLEGMPLADQARLFNDSEIIISAHGAGLSNLVFCEPKTKVLEIFPEKYSTSNFFALASAGNLQYFCAVGRSIKSPLGDHLRDYDIQVDHDLITKFLSG